MQRYDIINSLIKKNNYQSYLEIGVQNKKNWNQINCQYKVGVDPDSNVNTTFNLTSDEFFKQNKDQFDIIFIDGLHEADQVYRDILNSLEVLKGGGVIVCHDMLPFDEASQIVPRIQKQWTGDCWKAFVKLRYERDDLAMFTVNTDCGCGIIMRGHQIPFEGEIVTNYQDFEKNKEKLMSIMSIEQFLMRL